MAEGDTPSSELSNERRVPESFQSDIRSIGALHGSARGKRNVTRRLEAMARVGTMTGEALLDVGCATGEYTTEMARAFERVQAIDVELNRLEIFRAAKPENVQIEVQSVYDLPFEAESFDTVTMIEVLEHLDHPQTALLEIARVLRPGGELVLTTPNRLWPFEQHGVPVGEKRYPGYYFPGLPWIKPLHRRMSRSDAFTRSDLADLARGADLELTGVTYMMPPLDSLPSGHRLHRATEAAEATPFRRFAQTIVACMRKPPSPKDIGPNP
jgi:ubiquinone/menaquinone biosynthesis C-methylase UbiE